MTTFWQSQRWFDYERAFGDVEGTRAELFASATWKTRVLDLRPHDAELWRDIRRSYHSVVNKLTRDGSPEIFHTFGSKMRDDLEAPRCLHAMEAGRETRPLETWHIMAEWVRSSRAICVCSYVSIDENVSEAKAYAYFAMHGNWAYYFSAASVLPNQHHGIMWHAIQDLKNRGIEWLEIGWQGHATDEKGKNIEFFRRGWGGVDIPVKFSGCAQCIDWATAEHAPELVKCLSCGRTWQR